LKRQYQRSAYDDDEDDDDDDELDNSENCHKASKEKSKDKDKNVWKRVKILLQPTSDWGPASKNLTLSRTLIHTSPPGNAIILRT
jgi:solute carrier family 6 amino acid transporter-like protein 5/7/9/14